MKENKFLKEILITLTLLVVGVVALFVLVFFMIKAKNEQISNLKNNLSSYVVRQQNMMSMDRMVKNATSDIDLVNSSVVASDGDVKFIENLEGIAKDNGLTMKIDSLVFENNPSVASSSMVLFNIKANTTGAWAGTYRFLAQIESLPFKIKVSNLAFLNAVDETVFDANKLKSDSVWQGKFEISVLKYK
jgi:hypothetical protein